MSNIRDLMVIDVLRCGVGGGMGTGQMAKPGTIKQPAGNAGPSQRTFQNDQSDFQDEANPSAFQPQQTPELTAAPYVKMLTKLGYEYQGTDQEDSGMPIGHTFAGEDGDMIMVKPDGSWRRFGPGAQNTQGKSVQDLGNALIKDSLTQGDDSNPHSALRQAGYSKIHTDQTGNNYYKHPQTGKTVAVTKDGQWKSSVGSGRGANKLRDFLGNESFEQQDPMVQKQKMQNDQMKQKAKMQQQQGGGGRPGNGTRGGMGTRGGGVNPRPSGFGGRGGM